MADTQAQPSLSIEKIYVKDLSLENPGAPQSFTTSDAPRINAVRPFYGYGSINALETAFDSNYHSLQVAVNRSMAKGLMVKAAYTYSKAIDDVSSFNISGSGSIQVAGENDLAQNPNNLAAERGPSLFDARHLSA